MIKTRVIIVEQSHTHTHIVRKKREKHFMTRAIVKLSAVKPGINTSSKRLAAEHLRSNKL